MMYNAGGPSSHTAVTIDPSPMMMMSTILYCILHQIHSFYIPFTIEIPIHNHLHWLPSTLATVSTRQNAPVILDFFDSVYHFYVSTRNTLLIHRNSKKISGGGIKSESATFNFRCFHLSNGRVGKYTFSQKFPRNPTIHGKRRKSFVVLGVFTNITIYMINHILWEIEILLWV